MKVERDEYDAKVIIAQLQAKLAAKEKTINVLMDAVERRIAEEPSSLELLSHNVTLERVVKQKTETLEQQSKELREALHTLQLTQTQLLQAQKMESIGQLAAGIAHEINTPSQFIGSNIDFLKASFEDVSCLMNLFLDLLQKLEHEPSLAKIRSGVDKRVKELDWEYLEEEIPAAIEQSQDGIRRVSTIVQAMKEFSHPGGKEKSYHDLNKIIETAVTVTANEWKYCANLVTQLDENLPQVLCLGDEMGQVILNIIINAAHAINAKNSQDGNEKGHIAISSSLSHEHVVISIKDNGLGIPESIRTRVFDPFFTTKTVGKGTGQGLAISHDVIVNKHGGNLDFVSEVGKGTELIIQLPIEQAEEN